MSKNYNDLKPQTNFGKKKLGKFIVFDIESNDWKDYVLGGIYDGETFESFSNVHDLCAKLDTFKNTKIFAHFGGIFDFLFLLDTWGIENSFDSDIVMRGSSVFTFKRGSNTFIDSSGILPFSLESAAKGFMVSHQKLSIDHTKKKTITPKLIKYLKHDCISLYEVIERFYAVDLLEGINFKPTLASQSLEVLRSYLTKSIPSINSRAKDEFIRQGYAGGRVEIFRPIYQSVAGKNLFYYDFNSLYPAVMRDLNVPGKIIRISKKVADLSIVDCEVEAPKNVFLPVLWKKGKNKFFFPTGKFRGVFPSSEIHEAVRAGYTIHKVFKSMEFENLGPLFKDYIDDLYRIKNDSTDPVRKMIGKLFLNAGYGRLAIKRDKEILVIDDGSNGLKPTDIFMGDYRLAKKPNYFRGFSHPAIGAFITAEARLKLYRAMLPIQDKVYYCDTDSIVTTEKLPVSNKLGELKLEGTSDRACFLLPKTYVFGNQVKMKGFPKEFAQSLNFQDFAEALDGDLRKFKTEIPEKLMRLRSAKNNNKSVLKVMEKTTRQIRSRYDKRKLLKINNEWTSEPLDVKEI